jgi:ribonuclease VapC
MSKAVLDSSAVLAFLRREPGHECVRQYIGSSVISAANHSESICKLVERGTSVAEAVQIVGSLMLDVEPVTERQSVIAAVIHERTRRCGLSLGDRSCLALATDLSLSVVTADRSWADLPIGVMVELIR